MRANPKPKTVDIEPLQHAARLLPLESVARRLILELPSRVDPDEWYARREGIATALLPELKATIPARDLRVALVRVGDLLAEVT